MFDICSALRKVGDIGGGGNMAYNEQAYNQWRLLNDELTMKYYTTFSNFF